MNSLNLSTDNDLETDIASFWQLLFEITMDLERRLHAHMHAHNLTPPQFYVLKTLMEEGGRCRIGHIAEAHSLTGATMTGLVRRLEAMQPPLVQREPATDDKRAVEVVLTVDGQARFLAIQGSLMRQVRMVMQLLPPEERAGIIERVQKYFRMMTELFPADEIIEG
ncbi:MAG: MarR family winged helix-turn-helix transcriptional regulator [Aggregatilineales bacterium]